MVSPKQHRKLRSGIERDPQAYLSNALVFLQKRLGWTLPGNCRIILRRLEPAEFEKYHPRDRLAGEVEGEMRSAEGSVVRIHNIHFNWRKLTDIDHKGFILQYLRCLIHELLEVYAKHNGKRLVHERPNEDQPTDAEIGLTDLFLEEELRIPRGEFSEYEWKSV